MNFLRRLSAATASFATGAVVFAGHSQAAVPTPWQMWSQPAASPVAEQIESLHILVMVIITVITIFVAGLLAWVCYRYSEKKNPTPSQTSHNTLLEVAWTVIPVLILVVIAIPSFRLVYFQDRTEAADLTIKVTGHQWYWEYTYPDAAGLNFTSYMVAQADLKPGQLRLLDVDNQVVVPVGKNIRILTTSADVIHSFFIPSLGVQRYAIPGRTIETWVRVDRPGTYYGECNQICGQNHSSMPIAMRAVSASDYAAWLAEAKKKFAANPAVDASRLAATATQGVASATEETKQ